MYHKGDIVFDKVDYDAREENGYEDTYKYSNEKIVALPHSCNEWVIGGEDEVKILIEDLQNILLELKK